MGYISLNFQRCNQQTSLNVQGRKCPMECLVRLVGIFSFILVSLILNTQQSKWGQSNQMSVWSKLLITLESKVEWLYQVFPIFSSRMALKRSYLEILFVPPLLLLFHRTSKSGWRESRRMLAPAFFSENSHCLCVSTY